MTDLRAQRTDAESRLAAARQRRGAAALDGLPYDDAEIVAAENEIAALDEAEAEATRRRRADAEKEWRQARKRLIAELRDKEEARLTNVKEAGRALRAFVEATNAAIAISAAERTIIQKLGAEVPTALGPLEIPRRISALASDVLANIAGHKHRLGDLTWHHTGRRPVADWREHERRGANIESIVLGE